MPDSAWPWVLPLSIFVGEMAVVTLGTLRIIFVSRGCRVLAPVLGFFEILLWLFAIGQTMRNLEDPACFLAFALGFTLGNWLGIRIESFLAMGHLGLRVFVSGDTQSLVQALRAENFGVTCVQALGGKGPVTIVMTVIRRRQLQEVLHLIRTHQPTAFFAIDDVQTAHEGIFPMRARGPGLLPTALQIFRRSPRAVALEVPRKQAG